MPDKNFEKEKKKKSTHCLGIQEDVGRGVHLEEHLGEHLGGPLHLVEVMEGYHHQEGEGRVDVLRKGHVRVEPRSRERGPTKSLRRPTTETRRRHKPRSTRRKMLGSKAKATRGRASA